MDVLTVQSHVAYGHVGNAAAVFCLQRLGVQAWPVHTVQFSNHTGYGAWRGRVYEAGDVTNLVQGIAERGVLGRCDAVLSGYLGSAAIGRAVLDAVVRVRAASPDAVYCCDPVMGDLGRGVFAQDGIPALVRDEVLPAADLLTPNHFELDLLAGRPTRTLAEVLQALSEVRARGPHTVLTTSLVVEDTPPDAVDLLVTSDRGSARVRTPRLDLDVNGAGDAVAALFLASWLRTRDPEQALQAAASSVFGVLRATAEAGSRELLLVSAQEELVAPSQTFPVERV